MPGLRRHPVAPGADGGVGREVEAAFGRDVRVRVERDVGERVVLAHQELTPSEPLLQHGERGMMVRGWSNPTQTPVTTLGVNPTNQAST